MKTPIRWMLVMSSAFLYLACDPPNEGAVLVDEPPILDPPAMTLSYVSAHLGNTWDCSQPGVRVGTQDDRTRQASAAPSDEGFAGDCMESACGAMNCEDGVVLLHLRNVGETSLSGLTITDIQLLRADETELAFLPVKTVTLLSVERMSWTDSSETIAAGETANIRIEFKAPHSADLMDEQVLRLRIIAVSDEGADAELITPEVQVLPVIVT